MITGNEPATGFGIPETNKYGPEVYTGLTIRQHFAAMAMQGLCVSTETMQAGDIPKLMEHFAKKYGREVTIAEALAQDAVIIADALIIELNKDKQ